MNIHPAISQEIVARNGMITTAQVMSLGFSKMLLTNYVKCGLLERIGHGMYMMPNSIVDDTYTLMLRSKHIIFSHETAFFLHGLSDRTPFAHSVTVPDSYVLPKSMRADCTCYYIKAELHTLGATHRKTTFGNMVRCYDLERTICDMARTHSRVDEEMFLTAIKKYAASNRKNLHTLATYADRLRVSRLLKNYLDVLL